MSIASAIENAQIKVENAYTAVENKGGTLPETQNLTNLPNAIESIPSGSGGDTILLENKSGATISADKKVLCNLSAAISEPQKFSYYSQDYNPLCIYDSDNFLATTASSAQYCILYSDYGLKEIKQYFSSLSNLAGCKTNYVYHPNGIISSNMASGWTGQDCYIVADKNTLVTIPNKCQYLGSYNGTHYVFDRRENYHSIRTYDITTNTIGTEVVSVPDVNYLYYGYMSGDKIFVYKQSYYAIYQLQTATTATKLKGSSAGSILSPFYMTGVEVGDYIFNVANYGAYYDVYNSSNKPAFLKVQRIKSDYTLETVHLPELEMFETTPCYFCYDNRSNILSIGTHNNAYFYEFINNSTFKRINVVFDELPNNNGYAYRAYMTPNKSKVIVESMKNDYYFYDVKYPEQFISVDSFLNYNNESNITGYATGDTSSDKYEVSTVLPNVSNVSLDFGIYATPDELSAYGNAGEITSSEKVYQIPTYDNVPFKLIMRKAGYYDLVWNYLNSTSVIPLIWGSPYSSYTAKDLNYALRENKMTISIPSGELPDKSICDNVVGFLDAVDGGVCYDNYTKVGDVFADKRTGLASNFTTSNYLTKELSSLGDNWEVYLKMTTGSSTITGGQEVFTLGTAGDSDGYVFGYINNAGTGMWWTIGGISTDTFSISNNTTYYFKVGCDGEKTYVYMSTSGYESMTLVKEEATVVSVPAYTMFLGYNTTLDGKGAFKGIMDLSQTYIKVNNSIYWTANSGKYPFNGTGYDNFNRVGSVTVDNYTGLVTNFSTSNYLTKSLNSLGSNWEIYFKFTTSSSTITGGQKVFTIGAADGSSLNTYLYVANSGTTMWWNVGGVSTSQINVTNSTTYYFKVGCDGEKTYVYMSAIGYDNMTLVKEESTVISIPAYTMFLGYNLNTTDPKGAFGGSIDLTQTYIKVNGAIYWRAYSDEYIFTGTGFDNFIKVGSVTVNSSSGYATNFSQSNYISVPLDAYVSTLDIIAKGRISSTSNVCTIIGNDNLVVDNGYLACWYNTSYARGSTFMSTNKDYWYRLIYDGTNRIGYILEDNNYTLDTLPDLSQWSQQFSVPRSWSSHWTSLRIGSHINQSTQYFRGTLYLSGFNISVNGNQYWSPRSIASVNGLLPSGVTDDGSAQTWNLFYDNGEFLADTTSPMTGYSWCGSVTVPAHGVPIPPSHNFTVVGNLQESDGVYSGFGDDDYIELDTNLLVGGYTYIFKFTTGDDLSYFQNVLAPDNWFEVYVENGNLNAWIESEGSPITCGTVSTETTYWVKVETTANSVTLSYSTDGVTYTGATSSSCIKGTTQQFNVGHGVYDFINRNWNGSIDMANSHIYYNGNTIW